MYRKVWASVALLLVMVLLATACAREAPQKTEITGLIFTRHGATLQLSEAVAIQSVAVLDVAGAALATTDVDEETALVDLDFAWREGTSYKFTVQTETGTLEQWGTGPSKPAPVKMAEFVLEEPKAPASYEGMRPFERNPRAVVVYSPDGKFAVVGSQGGFVRVFDSGTGKLLWENKVAAGQISYTAAFSPDGRTVVVGESSVEGFVRALDVSTGEEKWSYPVSNEVGKGKPAVRFGLTSVSGIVTDKRGGVYVTGNRTEMEVPKGAKRIYMSRLYKFDVGTGELLWRWPKDRNVDNGIRQVDTVDSGEHVVLTIGKRSDGGDDFPGALYVLNGETGEIRWSYEFPPLTPYYKEVWAYYTTNISPDARWATVVTLDGRAWAFNNQQILAGESQPQPAWVKDVGTPIDVGGVLIRAPSARAYSNGEYLAMLTINTSTLERGAKAPVEHPNAASMLVFDMQGKLLWRFPLSGTPANVGHSRNGRFLAIPVSQDLSTRNLDTHGIYVFDTQRPGGVAGKLAWFYPTKGIAVAAAISDDGRNVAVVEAPIDIDPREEVKDVIGQYKVHFLK